MIRKCCTAFLALFLVTVLTGCTKPKKVEKINIKLQQDLVIEDSDENIHRNFSFIRAVDIDAAGNIYLIDKLKMSKFDKSGKFLWVIDKMGQGPGEFLRIVDLALSNDGKVIYSDQNNLSSIFRKKEGQMLLLKFHGIRSRTTWKDLTLLYIILYEILEYFNKKSS